MGDTFYLADLHLGHKNIHTFRRKSDGSAFDSSEEHDEFICDMWQDSIPKGSRVIIAGDVAFNTKGLEKLTNLTGDKHVVLGNHDKGVSTLLKYVGGVSAMKMKSIDGFHTITTHIPIHFSQLERWHLNIHGHTHYRSLDDNRYFNVSIEALDYKPVTIDDILTQVTRNEWGTGK